MQTNALKKYVSKETFACRVNGNGHTYTVYLVVKTAGRSSFVIFHKLVLWFTGSCFRLIEVFPWDVWGQRVGLFGSWTLTNSVFKMLKGFANSQHNGFRIITGTP